MSDESSGQKDIVKLEIYSALSREIDGQTGTVSPRKIVDHAMDYRPSDEVGTTIDKVLNMKQTDPNTGTYVTALIDEIEEARKDRGNNFELKYIKQGLVSKSRSEVSPHNRMSEVVEDALTSDQQSYKLLNITVEVKHIVG